MTAEDGVAVDRLLIAVKVFRIVLRTMRDERAASHESHAFMFDSCSDANPTINHGQTCYVFYQRNAFPKRSQESLQT